MIVTVAWLVVPSLMNSQKVLKAVIASEARQSLVTQHVDFMKLLRRVAPGNDVSRSFARPSPMASDKFIDDRASQTKKTKKMETVRQRTIMIAIAD